MAFWTNLKRFRIVEETTDPTADDDSSSGFGLGDIWINTSTPQAFMLLDDTVSSAVWAELTPTP